jgi:hypothetical protein
LHCLLGDSHAVRTTEKFSTLPSATPPAPERVTTCDPAPSDGDLIMIIALLPRLRVFFVFLLK